MTKKILSPTDACCKRVCEDLDEEIESIKESIGIKSLKSGDSHNTQDSIDILKDFRDRLEEEGICKCIAKKEPLREPGRKRYPPAISIGLTRIARSGTPILPSPLANGCCIHVCRALNSQIRSIDDILDASVIKRAGAEMESLEIEAEKREAMGRRAMTKETMEKRALRKAEWELTIDARFSSLVSQSYTMKRYRSYMKKNGICGCEK